ncbi:MAG: CDP-alcohol phosphatidyltransferase family protein [Chitinophagaceae bacterium]
MKQQIPNILTLANLFCGALAIIFTLHAPNYIAQFNGQDYVITNPEPVYLASILIGVAAIFDFLDGWSARFLRVGSPLGKELDSLADVITFGLAPGMILYQMLRVAYLQTPEAMDISLVYLTPALLIPCFAAYRLARFNLNSHHPTYFEGVPVPAVGLLVASFPLITLENTGGLSFLFLHIWLLYLVIFVLAFLMVSRWPMMSLKFTHWGFRGNLPRYLWIALSLISLPFLQFAAVPFAFILYIILSLLFKNKILET